MRKLFTNNGIYELNRVLSSRFPFQIYKATNQSGNNVIIKTVCDLEDTITSTLDTFQTFHGHDLKTSIWYGHRKAQISEIKSEELLETQYKYLKQCSIEYNITNCLFEKDTNGKTYLIYDFIEGESLSNYKMISESGLFLQMIPSLLRSISKYPHGDLSFENLILHSSKNKFSIIDPAVTYDLLFFTNTEYYPLVPPLFYSIKDGYATFADQLAIGLMLYKSLTGLNPLKKLTEHPFWANEFGNPIGGCITDDIYSILSIIPKSWGYTLSFNEYINSVRNQLKLSPNNLQKNNNLVITENSSESKQEFIQWTGNNNYQVPFPIDFFEIRPPKHFNNSISQETSDFCLSLIFNYEPIENYIYKLKQIINR
jgi:hypothetical protein